ncbi:MAG TPA: RtcB family protein [Chloroflexota bacterium]|nr:RtcB family protein [Chloroflexota bacterium]
MNGKTLKARGWPEGRVMGRAKAAASRLEADGLDREAILSRLDEVRSAPDTFLADAIVGDVAAELVRIREKERARTEIPVLHDAPLPYGVWGPSQIDAAAIAQMDDAMRLPVSAAGALMPDAHVGYGLPIGGVLATEDAVIPYAVGVDIACRMRLSVYPESPTLPETMPERFERSLLDRTYFGAGVANPQHPEHEVLDDRAWRETRLLSGLQGTAARQIGTSGTGNHFVEWGVLTITAHDPGLGLEPGDYLALLSHSGSRGVGFKIANAYSELAMRLHPNLDKRVRHLAWLPLDSEAGQEYWHAMELAGRFASANHQIIHHNVARAASLSEVAVVENHHNFAWKETVTDASGRTRELVVHRKGATPAGPGVLGIIPGSMGDPGYVVRGRGQPGALASASHGAGRAMSRRQALERIPKAERDRYLEERGVRLLGGGIDESPQAYKSIDDVVAAQEDLVDVIGRFTPRIVRMASEPGDI